jgi:DNA-binding GntR family transcriptional regulator
MKQENVAPSRLQRDLLPEILSMIRAEGLEPGARLVELSIAARLGVYRTPVRAALNHLADAGVALRAVRGFTLARVPADDGAAETNDDADRLSLCISSDWMKDTLPADLSEADLRRRYAVSRGLLKRALGQLEQVGVLERKRGHGWHFLPAITDLKARAESYRFRMVIETAALLEPGHTLAAGWIASTRARHQAMLSTPWRDVSSIAFYEMNADFHQGLAAGSNNRFLLQAVQQQNRLRRVSNYEFSFVRDGEQGAARVSTNCTDHLGILDAVEAGDMEVAAALMRRHLQQAQLLR